MNKKIMKFGASSMALALAAGIVVFTGVGAKAAGDVGINETNFPDENFRKILLEESYGQDGKLTSEEISGITSLALFYKEISDLKGIEFFTELEELYCYGNEIKSLDVSKNTKLKKLDCGYNEISNLNVSGCKDLVNLNCRDNKITKLDLKGYTALEELHAYYNPLDSINVNGCKSLKEINFMEKELKELDATGCSSVEQILVQENKLTSLKVSGCSSMTRLECNENQITSLDLTGCTALSELSCRNNKIESIDVSNCTALRHLDIGSNKLTKLDASNSSKLEYLDFYENSVTDAGLKISSGIKELYCAGNKLEEFDFSGLKSVEILNCNDNKLTKLDVSNLTKLRNLLCEENQLTSLDVSNLKDLLYLRCGFNKIKSLDLKANSGLSEIYCNNNAITNISFSTSKALNLDILVCNNNKLKELDLTNADALGSLECYENDIKDLDISQCSMLVEAYTKDKKPIVSDDKKYISYSIDTNTYGDDGSFNDDGYFAYLKVDKDVNIYAESIINKTEATVVCGKTITLKATTNNSKAKVTWSISDSTIASVDKNGKVKGKMAGTVTITAKAGPASGKCVVTVLYKDVKDSKKFWYTPTNYLTKEGVVKGYDKQTKFKPANDCTRAQMLTFMWRLEGEPEPASKTCKFPDVKKTDYFFKPVIWAVEKGITTGYKDGTFKPQNVCTRAQTVTFLWRMAGQPEPGTSKNNFTDVEKSDYFYIPVLWASRKKIVAGYDDCTFRPQGKCLRRQMVTFLYKYDKYENGKGYLP